MKTLIVLLFSLLGIGINAQDYYSITQESNHTTWNYPADVKMILYDAHGQAQIIDSKPDIKVTGDYRLEIETSWNSEKEIIESNGQSLKIGLADHAVVKGDQQVTYNGKQYTQKELDAAIARKPKLESKLIEESSSKKGTYNLEASFTNNLTFTYKDGKTKAVQNGKELEITNGYLVQTPEGLLKLSFRPSNGEFWYVFEI